MSILRPPSVGHEEKRVVSRAEDPFREIRKKIDSLSLKLSTEPLYNLARQYAKLATEVDDPYEKLSYTFTALSLTAYSAQLRLVRIRRGFRDFLPPKPVKIRIDKDSLPKVLLEKLVESTARFLDVYAHDLKNAVAEERNVYVYHYVDNMPLEVLAMMSRHKDDVDRAYVEVMRVLDMLRR